MTHSTRPQTHVRLLVADDDEELCAMMVSQLEGEGFSVQAADSVASIRAAIAAGAVDLIVLDLNLPDGDGLTLCRALRAEGHAGGVIMVTARGSAIDRVLGLEGGADDYLVKPFEPRELLARIRNLLRRQHGEGRSPHRGPRFAHFGGWRLDFTKRRLIAADDGLVMLSATEFEILAALVQAPNTVLSRESLLPKRAATAAFDRSIDTQISRLRHKLGVSVEDRLIVSVRSQGYLLASEVRFA